MPTIDSPLACAPPADIWSFALQLYAKPNVESACLRLQNAEWDVCLLLAGAWLDRNAVGFSLQRREALAEHTEYWRLNVIRQLRQLRQDWRALAANDAPLKALRDEIKAMELNAERQALERCAILAKSWATDPAASLSWLEQHLTEAVEQDRVALTILRDAARQIT